MFTRQSTNKSGSIRIKVVATSSYKDRIIRTIGSHCYADYVKVLRNQSLDFVDQYKHIRTLKFIHSEDASFFSKVKQGLKQVETIVRALILGKLFDQIGFNIIEEELF